MGNLGQKALTNQAKKFDGQSNVDVANKLLIEKSDEDYNILLQLGLNDHDLDTKLESIGEYKRITEYGDEYGYCVNREVLEDIAYKYDLTLGKSKYYKYSVPVTIVADIKEWSKLTGINTADSDSFYILAPSEAFYTSDEYKELNDYKKCQKTGSDPMLVHEIAGSSREGNAVYSLITEWGGDLNPLRKIKSYFVNRSKTFTILGMLVIIFAATAMVYHVVNTLTTGFVGNDWVTIWMGIITFIGSSIIMYPFLDEIDPENKSKKYFDFTELELNFKMPSFYYYHHRQLVFNRFFANIFARFLLVSAFSSIVFFIFFISYNSTSFANDLGVSGWYFLIPLGVTGILFVIGLITKALDNLNWN